MSGQDLKAVKHFMDQVGMRFFVRRTVAAQNGVKLFLNTQTAQHGNGQPMHLVAHDDHPFASKVVENLMNARIENRLVEKVAFVAREENIHYLRKVISAILGQ